MNVAAVLTHDEVVSLLKGIQHRDRLDPHSFMVYIIYEAFSKMSVA